MEGSGQRQLPLQHWTIQRVSGVSEWLGAVAGEKPGLDSSGKQVRYKLSFLDSDFSSFSTPRLKWFLNLFSRHEQCEWNNVRSDIRFWTAILFSHWPICIHCAPVIQQLYSVWRPRGCTTVWPPVSYAFSRVNGNISLAIHVKKSTLNSCFQYKL